MRDLRDLDWWGDQALRAVLWAGIYSTFYVIFDLAGAGLQLLSWTSLACAAVATAGTVWLTSPLEVPYE